MNFLGRVKGWFSGASGCKDADEDIAQRAGSGQGAGSSEPPPGARVKRVAVGKKREPLLLDPSELSGVIGVQGLGWFTERLHQDADGDVAMEFMELECPGSDTPTAPVVRPVSKEIVGLEEGRVVHT
mmetsp:Transcript_13301/g.34164  ORF Transcript_13301/g.34164 Transcript_13301/m.34164 type:complete len:127 (+) Transcript_13301:526-906(+)|eukprot:jgi/Tetstr1/445663/TSEL_003468.t1